MKSKNIIVNGSLVILGLLLFVTGVNAQFKPVADGTIDIDGRTWITKDIGEIYTPAVYSYDELNGMWKVYGSGTDFARTSDDDIGATILTKIPNGDWELIIRVVSPDFVYATGYAYKEIWLDDGTGTGTNKLYYPGEVLAPQPRHSSNQRFGIVFRENLNKRCREFTMGTGRFKCRQCARAVYEEDEDGNILSNAMYTYTNSYRGSAESKNPTWLRIVKRGSNWSSYYAMTYPPEVQYESADDVKWTKWRDFSMEMDSANIYAGIFFGSGINYAFRGSSFEVRDPRVQQTFDNLILREAPPLWQLAQAQPDMGVPMDMWLEKDITNMFDHDLTDDLDYQIESSDENVAFAYIDNIVDGDGYDKRVLKIKGISTGVAKMRIWWDIGGYHLEDAFYVNVSDPVDVDYRETLFNHVDIGGDPASSVIESEDDENGLIRILRNGGGNNHSGYIKRMMDAAIYYPMTWDGTPDSIEIVYNALSDTRFFGTGGIALVGDLTDVSTAAGVGEHTTVSGGIGYQTTYFFTRPEGSQSLSWSDSPGFKSGDSKTNPNQVLYQTHLKLVRTGENTVELYSKRPVDTEWEHQSKVIDAIGDYYFIVHQSQTRSGSGSFFSNLRINGEEIQVEDQDLSMNFGETKRFDILGHLGQKLGEDWSNFAIQSTDESRFKAYIEGKEFVVEEVLNKNATEIVPINITAIKNGESYSHTLYARLNPQMGMDTVELKAFLENDNSPSVDAGDNENEFFISSYQQKMGAEIADEYTFLYQSVEMADSSDATVYIEELSNSGEMTRAGLAVIADNLSGTKQYVALLATPEEGLKFQYRWKEGVETVIEDVELEEGVNIDLSAPIYLKLRKVGKWFYPYVSEDGSNWYIARKYAFPLDMEGATYKIGFAVATTEEFNLLAKCHINNFEITVGEDIGQLNNYLPKFKSISMEGKEKLYSDEYVKAYVGSDRKAVVEYSSTNGGEVNTTLFDIYGRTVRVFSSVNLPSGIHRIELNVSDVTMGIYILRSDTPAGTITEKLILR